ncbi:toxin-antitoxin system, antitoxin component, Xre family protein [Blastomonas natatoria]|nr:toxin-antitoxin system, antitoxin component, Xre family protein [Blastomonas natatoria]
MATAPEPKPVPRALIEKIGMLSRARQSEVEDFVDFIAMRDAASADTERELSRMVTAASGPTFAAVWDNPEDDVYDAL